MSSGPSAGFRVVDGGGGVVVVVAMAVGSDDVGVCRLLVLAQSFVESVCVRDDDATELDFSDKF